MLEAIIDGAWVPLTPDEYYITETADGMDTLEFSLLRTDPAAGLLAERTRIHETSTGQSFWISGVDAGQEKVAFEAQKDLSEWQRTVLVNFSNGSGKATLRDTVEKVMPEGWSLQFPDGEATLAAGFTMQGPTPLEVVTYALEVYGCGAVYDNRGKILYLHELGKKTLGSAFFVDTANLRSRPEYKGKVSSLVTRLYAQGADGVTFAAINDGKSYIECFDYTDEVIAGFWRDDRYTVPEHLLAAAQDKLRALSQPERSWTLDICDLNGVDPEAWPGMELNLFDVARLVDRSRGQTMEVQILELRRCPHHPEKNQVTVGAVAGSLGMTRTGLRRWRQRERLYEGLELSVDQVKSTAESAREEAENAQNTANNAQTAADQAQSSADSAQDAAQKAEEKATEAVASVEALGDSIVLSVTDGAVGKEASIVLSVDGEEQKGTIDLTGAVSFTDLKTAGKTTIHGSNIQTGTITAEKIDVEDLMAQDITATGDFSVDNGVWEIKTSSSGVIMGCGLEEGDVTTAYVACRPSKVVISAYGNSSTVDIGANDILVNGEDLFALFAGKAPVGMVHEYRVCADDAAIDAFIQEQIDDSSFAQRTKRNIVVYPNASGTTLTYGYSWFLEIWKGTADYGTVTAYGHASGRPNVLRRVWSAGTLGQWLWENPPMTAGKEYPTTERSGGKTVYRKLLAVDMEAFGSSTAATITTVTHGISDLDRLVSMDVTFGTGCLPYVGSSGGIATVNYVGATAIGIRTYNIALAAATWYFDMKYTKA